MILLRGQSCGDLNCGITPRIFRRAVPLELCVDPVLIVDLLFHLLRGAVPSTYEHGDGANTGGHWDGSEKIKCILLTNSGQIFHIFCHFWARLVRKSTL